MANKFDVKVNVEFNAIMGRLNNALDDFKTKLANIGNAIGNKDIGTQLSNEFDKTVKKLNELNNANITPQNFDTYQKKLAELQDRLEKLKELQKEVSNTPFTSNLEDIDKRRKEIEAQLKQIKTDNEGINFRKSRDWFNENHPELSETKERVLALNRELRALNKEYETGEIAQKEYEEGSKVLNSAIKDIEEGSNRTAAALRNVREEEEKASNEKLANTIQTQVNRYIGLNAVWRYSKKYIQDLVKTYKEFDESLVAIAAVTGQTRDQMWKNIGDYNKMAQSLGATTQEVINASKLYYQQGLTTTSVMKLTEETVKLATIAELDSADATEYLTTAMNGFKLSAEESTRVTDVWANLAAKTASDVDELAVAISKVASLAENAGMEIETASAFLNQMIETTREAPENLGTALKTIIARFQELKVSEEALSDGVDANKVERALKTAGVALRGLDGQFRDFDEVILELSSKWDTLDRNTQRYIATIAAGSRQQSRFIAMVSDYEGLLRNVNYAYDSLGSADAQMAVFQEGLTASTNRLTAAWEGLYTSWSESATIISKVIDGMASLVSTLADIGAVGSGIIATFLGLTAAIAASAAMSTFHDMALKAETKSMRGYIGAAIKATAQNIALAASQAAVIAAYVIVIGLIALLVYEILKLINAENEKIKQLDKDIQKNKQLAAQEKDRASNLGVLSDELTNAYKRNEDLSEIRQKIIDQFGPEIQGVDVLTASYKELNDALLKEQKIRNLQAAGNYYVAQQKEKEKYEINRRHSAEDTVNDSIKYTHTETQSEANSSNYIIEEKAELNGVEFIYDPYAKEYISADGIKLEDAKKEAYEQAYKNYGDYEPNENIVKFQGKSIAEFLDLKLPDNSEFDFGSTIALMLRNSMDNFFDEEGNLLDDAKERLLKIPDQLGKVLLTDEQKQKYQAILDGTFEGLTSTDASAFLEYLRISGVDSLIIDELQNNLDNVQDFYNANPVLEEIYGNLAFDVKAGIADALSSVDEDDFSVVQDRINNFIAELGDNFTGSMARALSSQENMEQSFSAIYRAIQSADEETAEKLKQSGIFDYFELLKTEIGELSGTFLEGDDTAKLYYAAMTNLAALEKGELDNESYLATLEETITLLTELTGLTEEEVRNVLESASARNSATTSILEQNAAVKQLAHSAFLEAEESTNAKKQELLAYAAAMDAAAEELEARADALDAKKQQDETESENNAAKSRAMDQNAVTLSKTLDDMGEAAHKAWEEAIGSDESTNYQRVEAEIREYTDAIEDLNDAEALREAAGKLRERAEAARGQALLLTLKEVDDKTKKTGGGSSKADDASKKYLQTLKDLTKQLKKVAEEAEAAAKREIAAILAVLEAEKAKLEEMQKEREEWRDKESEELELWIKAQIALLQEEQKAQEKAYQDNEDALSLQAEAAQTYYNQQIEAIQAKIDALDAESEAEDRLLKLQQARDAYNKAQNSKSRLVLTKGAGWIFKADQKEVADARKQLQDVQREIQKAAYQDQIDELQKQADEWEKIADGIGKSAEEIAKLAAAVEEFGQGIAAGSTGYADIDAFTQAVEALQSQKATMDFNADETAEGSLAYQIAQLEEALEKVGRSFEDQLLAERLEAITEVLRGQNEEQGYADTTGQILGHVETYMQEFSKVAHEYSETAAKIAEIEKSIELWKSIDENLGLTVEEIEEAKQLYDKYSKKFEKFGTKAFDEQSKAYKYMKEKLGKIAEYFSEAKEAEERAETYEQATKNGFSSGGVVDFYGPADLHGTIAEPEVVFNARQASALFNWVKSLSSFGIPQINGVNPTPVVATSNNSMRTNTISIGELYINSSANNFDGLVADITRNSMLRQPI